MDLEESEEWLHLTLAKAFALPVEALVEFPTDHLLRMHKSRLRALCYGLMSLVTKDGYEVPGLDDPYNADLTWPLSSLPATTNFAWVRVLPHGPQWRDAWLNSMSQEEQMLAADYRAAATFDVNTDAEFVFYHADQQLRLLMELHYAATEGYHINKEHILTMLDRQFKVLMRNLPKITALVDAG